MQGAVNQNPTISPALVKQKFSFLMQEALKTQEIAYVIMRIKEKRIAARGNPSGDSRCFGQRIKFGGECAPVVNQPANPAGILSALLKGIP
jgi:hypothetical protein